MNEWVTIRTLKTKGVGIKKIARQLGISRNTVRKYLRSDKPPQYTNGQRINQEIAPFIEETEVMLAQGYIGSRILEELRKKGYQGAQATFYRYLKGVKTKILPGKVVQRFETAPGEQGQYDWSEYTVEIGGALNKVYISSFILGYSRYQHFFPSLAINQGVIFEALEDSFRHLGGVPKEILFDNPRAIVTKPRPNLQWNLRFLELAGFYKFEPIACWPNRPQTKGKVEKPNYFLEQHFIIGNSFRDFADFCQRLAQFEAERVNARIHGTTQQRPIDRLEQERHLLTKLPNSRFISTKEAFRKVNWDALISFDGSRYSVPWQYAGKSVWVRASRGIELEVYSQQGELIARHPLAVRKGTINLKKEHYDGLRQRPPNTRALIVKVFQDIFPDQTLFLEKLLAQYKFNATAQLREILNLVRSYPKEALCKTFQLALKYNTFSANFLRGILAQGNAFRAPVMSRPVGSSVPMVDVGRSLEVYQAIITDGE